MIPRPTLDDRGRELPGEWNGVERHSLNSVQPKGQERRLLATERQPKMVSDTSYHERDIACACAARIERTRTADRLTRMNRNHEATEDRLAERIPRPHEANSLR
jgi:hypothetical protein